MGRVEDILRTRDAEAKMKENDANKVELAIYLNKVADILPKIFKRIDENPPEGHHFRTVIIEKHGFFSTKKIPTQLAYWIADVISDNTAVEVFSDGSLRFTEHGDGGNMYYGPFYIYDFKAGTERFIRDGNRSSTAKFMSETYAGLENFYKKIS